MANDLLRRLRFGLEHWVQRGAPHQIVLIAGLVGCVAFVGGCAAWVFTDEFEGFTTAVWWSFLRLTDPGYLGDDEGVTLRIISTTVTVLGYVLFMGSLIAIMSQWLALTLRKLESGTTPIVMRDHFVILGWTNRTPETIRKLLTARGRMDRFLSSRGSGQLRIVVLAEEVDSMRRLELRGVLGKERIQGRVFLRSGSSLQAEHLRRLDLLRAAIVMVPGSDFELGGAELTDTRVVKTLLNLDGLFRTARGTELPRVVAEVFDPRKVTIARTAVRAKTEIIVSDRLISRLLSQSLRHPGVADVLSRLFAHREGSSLYLRGWPDLAGTRPSALLDAFPRAIVLGVVSIEAGDPTVHLCSRADQVLSESDQLVLLAESFDDCVPVAGPGSNGGTQVQPVALEPGPVPRSRRLLVLGWSYRIPVLLTELMESSETRLEVTIMSRVEPAERDRSLDHLDFARDRLAVQNVLGDYSLEHDLHRFEPASFDNILFVASSWMGNSKEADARTVLGFLLLRSMLASLADKPEILVEILDPDTARILGENESAVFVSPSILSHLLAHVGLRPELNAVYDELICAGGAEIELRPPEDVGIGAEDATFRDVQVAAASRGCVALGCIDVDRSGPDRVQFNPARDSRWSFGRGHRVIVLSRTHDEV